MELSNFLIAFGITVFAGLSTALGACLAFFKVKDETKVLSFGLGFSGGVMIYLSFIEIIPKSIHYFELTNLSFDASAAATLCFFGGVVIAFLIDGLIPKDINPHEHKSQDEVYCLLDEKPKYVQKLQRTALFTAIAITIHNFPEGFATFVASLDNLVFGLSIAIAVAIHNIPEGLAVALPIYHATKDKKKALKLTVLSGFAEPVGAIVGYFILAPLLGDYTLAIAFGLIAGIMVFISIDSLLPESKLHSKGHDSVAGVFLGMGVMAVSLILL